MEENANECSISFNGDHSEVFLERRKRRATKKPKLETHSFLVFVFRVCLPAQCTGMTLYRISPLVVPGKIKTLQYNQRSIKS